MRDLKKLDKNKLFIINNLPIRFKLIILLMLISILPSIGLGVLTGWTVDHIIERQVNQNTLQLIGQVNKTLDFYAGNMQNMSYLIAFNPEIKQFLYEKKSQQGKRLNDDYQIQTFLQGLTTLYPEAAGILVVNSNGQYISNDMYTRSKKSLTEESWYQAAVESEGIFKILGHPSNRNITSHVHYKDDEVVSVVRAILDPDTQQVKGVILIDMKLRVISEATKDVRLGKSGYLMVIDDKGENIYSPSEPFLNKIPIDWFHSNEAGNYSKQVKGNKLQFIYRKSPFTGWTTVGVFSTKESVFEVREIHFYVISFVFFVCLFGLGASYYLSYSMSRPIRQLMSFMRKAELGDFSVRYKGERMDEIGLLGRSFNTMLVQINKLITLNEQQERQKREAELRSLQAHIKPHFLYNTLDTIHWLARKKGAKDVAELVESLSRLFRIGLSKGNDIIPLKEEMEHISSYLKIQKARYQEKLHYTLDIASNVERINVLKLVLQPIVENAIYHGIKERRGPGHIIVKAEEHDGIIVFHVKDDGKGIPNEKLEALRNKLGTLITQSQPYKGSENFGYGMINVQARIKLTFGDAYGISIDSEIGKGTTVKVVLPAIKEK
ncbi:sensor histidine kinase [Bacillus sp. sid0103]|uniref:cache domain-containing sensor histidine kinase n=1 Tax=Bacillus sp. sid0103 TaxID=2856337 RepID=UPI001C483673|nr:sensor histidine kinase [Bacillus sp. sid0103]MBV7505599.1 sensor histidine kinase [Bacillus sp. sid0103]